MAITSVRDILDMPVMRKAAPEVVAGAAGLGREVRWVHSAELAEIGSLLRGGDLLLSTGIALPDDPHGLATYARSLAENDAAGLIIELGRRWKALPQSLTDECDRLQLPVIALHNEARFAAVVQTVGERIVEQQLAELREAQRVHDTFTELSIAEAGPADILQAAQRLCGAAVVLEDAQHRVLDYRAGREDMTTFLQDWQTRSSRTKSDTRSSWDAHNEWLITRVGRRDRAWGRLIVHAPAPPSAGLVATAERAATALAMHRLHDRSRDTLVRRTHHELLVALANDSADPELQQRCELAGFPVRRRQFVAACVRLQGPASPTAVAQADDVIATITHHLATRHLPALVAVVDRDIRLLISAPATADSDDAVDHLTRTVTAKHAVVVTAGRAVTGAGDLARPLLEARQVLDALKPEQMAAGSPDRPYRLHDAHLRGLLALLADDPRLTLFVRRELAALVEHDQIHGTDLLQALRALVTHPKGKSHAAASMHMSRAAYYERLAKAANLLGVDLDDPDIRVSLHVALIAAERED